MSLMPEKEDYKEYTYEEWLELDNNEDTELIDGIVYMRYGTQGGARGGPSRRHQKISMKLSLKLGIFLEAKTCEIYADLKVKLNKNTVVRPDISVICDPDKLDDQGCNGAPDLIIEILSPSNMVTDLWTKRNKYLIAGVKEYWIVDPIMNEVTVYILKDGEYQGTLCASKDILPVTILPGCEIDLSAIFKK